MWWVGQGLWLTGAAWVLLAWSYEQWQADPVTSRAWWQTAKYISIAAVIGGLVLISQTTGERVLWGVVACIVGAVWYLGRTASAR